MKSGWCFIFLCIFFAIRSLAGNARIDSLQRELDRVIADRQLYNDRKQRFIDSLKQDRKQQTSFEGLYRVNTALVEAYYTFICDSAERYIQDNIAISLKQGSCKHLLESRLWLARVYSISGLFIQADEIFRSIKCDDLPDSLKITYCKNIIRYYGNLMRYTDDNNFSIQYAAKREAYIDTLMSVLDKQSDLYRETLASRLYNWGNYKEAVAILKELYEKSDPTTHASIILAMNLAVAYQADGDLETGMEYLIIAAIGDNRLAIKENEAMLNIVGCLYREGDIDRAYNYLKIVLDDANFYNSRFKNEVIARVNPIIESTYLIKLEKQKERLRIYLWIITVFAVVLAVTLYLTFKQSKMLLRAKGILKSMNHELVSVNKKLDEANLTKEKYIAYFMGQCALSINKLDEYRKDVNRKIKAGKVDDVYKISSRSFDKELEVLYNNFDEAFLNLFPDFVENFNSLLRPDCHYAFDKGKLNAELRIFALIRLGITDIGQIAAFLHYSVQTIYNYKSKVKRMSDLDGNLFEEKVKKLGSLSY